MHDGDLVLQRRLLRELRVELHVGLGVVIDQLDLPPEQTTGGVGLFDGQHDRIDHRLAVDVEPAREIVDTRDADRVFREGAGGEHAGGCGRCRTL